MIFGRILALCVCSVWVTEGFLVPVRNADSVARHSELRNGAGFCRVGDLDRSVRGEGRGRGLQMVHYPMQRYYGEYDRGYYPVQGRYYDRGYYPIQGRYGDSWSWGNRNYDGSYAYTQPLIRSNWGETELNHHSRHGWWGTLDATRMDYNRYDGYCRGYGYGRGYGLNHYRDNWHGDYGRHGDYMNYDRMHYGGVGRMGGPYDYRYGDNWHYPRMRHGGYHYNDRYDYYGAPAIRGAL